MKKIHVHCFQHVPFEGPGCIESWVRQKGHSLTTTKFYKKEPFPDIRDIDFLVVMGGPMGVNDECEYTYLSSEKRFIRDMILAGKPVLGICLGAQLMASALGAPVMPNPCKEIGWFQLKKTFKGESEPLLNGVESSFTAFHWHGDTFAIPAGAKHLFKSDACVNQAFLYGKNALALQFHLEVTSTSVQAMVQHGAHELVHEPFIQTSMELLGNTLHLSGNNRIMSLLLDKMSETVQKL
jgi:GMP synthase-like glutamine amidotransferase